MKKGFLIFLCSAFLVGCAGKEDNTSQKPAKEEPKVEEPSKEVVQEIVAPLSGLKVEEVSNQRPVAVMVNNHVKARPQSGLSQADLVYEVLAEGDITRFLAIFQSHMPERVGPVRSARDYFIELAKGYQSLYICHGNSEEARLMLEAGAIDVLNGMKYDGILFKRDNSRKAPHNSYITKEKIEEGAKENGYAYEANVNPLSFSNEKKDGLAASEIEIGYSKDKNYSVDYRYEDGTYHRYQGDVLATDLETTEPLNISTIFILEAMHTMEADGVRRNIDLNSGGRGYLFTNGTMREVLWKNQNGRILPVTENGEVIPFSPGQTWINVVPSLEIVSVK